MPGTQTPRNMLQSDPPRRVSMLHKGRFGGERERLRESVGFLSKVVARFQYLSKHLPQYFAGKIDKNSLGWIDAKEFLQKETWYFCEWADGRIDRDVFDDHVKCEFLCCRELVGACVKELLTNAHGALYSRINDELMMGIGGYIPRCKMRAYIETLKESGVSYFCIEVKDNGSACSDFDDASRLRRCWENRKRRAERSERSAMGLRFIDWVVGEHEGFARLEVDKEWTRFQLYFPKFETK